MMWTRRIMGICQIHICSLSSPFSPVVFCHFTCNLRAFSLLQNLRIECQLLLSCSPTLFSACLSFNRFSFHSHSSPARWKPQRGRCPLSTIPWSKHHSMESSWFHLSTPLPFLQRQRYRQSRSGRYSTMPSTALPGTRQPTSNSQPGRRQ